MPATDRPLVYLSMIVRQNRFGGLPIRPGATFQLDPQNREDRVYYWENHYCENELQSDLFAIGMPNGNQRFPAAYNNLFALNGPAAGYRNAIANQRIPIMVQLTNNVLANNGGVVLYNHRTNPYLDHFAPLIDWTQDPINADILKVNNMNIWHTPAPAGGGFGFEMANRIEATWV